MDGGFESASKSCVLEREKNCVILGEEKIQGYFVLNRMFIKQ